MIQTLLGRRNALPTVGTLGTKVRSELGTGVAIRTETRVGGAGAVGTAPVAVSDEFSRAGREGGAVVGGHDALSRGTEEGSSGGTEVGRAVLFEDGTLVEVVAEEGRHGIDLDKLDMDTMERVGIGNVEGGQRNGTAGLRQHTEPVGAALEGSRTEGADAAVSQTLHTASVATDVRILRTAVDMESLVKSSAIDRSVFFQTLFF